MSRSVPECFLKTGHAKRSDLSCFRRFVPLSRMSRLISIYTREKKIICVFPFYFFTVYKYMVGKCRDERDKREKSLETSCSCGLRRFSMTGQSALLYWDMSRFAPGSIEWNRVWNKMIVLFLCFLEKSKRCR